MAWTLCSKQDVVDLFPITENDLLDSWSDMVEALIRQHLGEPYLGTTQVITAEKHNGNGQHVLRLNNPPIVSVQAVRIDDSLLVGTDYEIFPTHIVMTGMTFPSGVLNVEVDYTSGGTPDYTVKFAAASMIIAIINYRRRAGADASLKWSSGDVRAGEESPNKDIGLTSHVTGIMKQLLRRPRVRMR